MSEINFIDERGAFRIHDPQHTSGLYLPIAGLTGLKSCVSPDFGGDAKTDQNHFLLAPKSISNLHSDRDTRNFFCIFEDYLWSATGVSALQESRKFTNKEEQVVLEGGRMWQRTSRVNTDKNVKAEVRLFSLTDSTAEVMTVDIINEGEEEVSFIPSACIPMYGRSADNLRDHRHVTSLLNRAVVTECGVVLRPTLSFDERGHQKNDTSYYVYGADDDGRFPVKFMADADKYLGEGGTYLRPWSLVMQAESDTFWMKAGDRAEGKETVAALLFEKVTLKAKEKKGFSIIMGIEDGREKEILDLLSGRDKIEDAFNKTKEYWDRAVPIHFMTGDKAFDNFMEWVSFQPQLRRIYGCSFLPYHDYGRGGRGWRDLWQDCLALLLTDPKGVGKMLLGSFQGVRMDGTNATIIGEKEGEFKSDRNGIPRVWMDHGFWPFLTTALYMDQTGDITILDEEISYFKDRLVCRAEKTDEEYDLSDGVMQKTAEGRTYMGTVLEHLLIQNLTAVLDVGEHNEIRLRNADWNDALDLAPDKGESVAFTCAYAGNLKDIARYLRIYKDKTGNEKISLCSEMARLINECTESLMTDPKAKRKALLNYEMSVLHFVSGSKEQIDVEVLADHLEKMSAKMMDIINENEWVCDSYGNGWFNGYYDNLGRKVEGEFDTSEGKNIRMMLTGQVFAIMSGTADKECICKVIESADKYLYKEDIGGYRLNTDFKALRTDLGRMFGFSYGDKENGAVFSHMEVMFGNALYKRGFAKEGFKALSTLYRACANFEKSRIYPGVPEYFNSEGRGLYHYLTGAASWYLLTIVTEVFGIRGTNGDLHLEPKLVRDQFDEKGQAKVLLPFREKELMVVYTNPGDKEYGEYAVEKIVIDGSEFSADKKSYYEISKEEIDKWDGRLHTVEIILG